MSVMTPYKRSSTVIRDQATKVGRRIVIQRHKYVDPHDGRYTVEVLCETDATANTVAREIATRLFQGWA